MYQLKINNYFLSVITFLLIIIVVSAGDCKRRKFQGSSFVCVCDSTYCDSIKPLPKTINQNEYVQYRTTKRNLRMSQSTEKFTKASASPMITISRAKKYQTIMGFGGAMTDASGINIASLPKPAQDLLMKQYFGEDGILYTIVRVPVGGTDFSTHPYTLDDVPNDMNFTQFKLAEEDVKYKIPYLKQAMKLSEKYPVKLMGCSWSAPAYMKDNDNIEGGGRLLDQYYQTHANYLVKFLKAYKDQGFKFYIMSAQNEPILGGFPEYLFNGMSFDATSEGRFVALLGPTMEANGFGDVMIMIGDDSRPFIYDYVREIFENKKAAQYTRGVGFHWYLDDEVSSEVLTDVRNIPGFGNKFILYSEACEGSTGRFRGVRLGSWTFGERYLENILDDLNHWSQGWVDWNLALNLQGGPNWAKNYVDAPIIVNKKTKEFYKNPMYYAIAHVSRFLVPGSVRIDLENKEEQNIMATAFETPYNRTVLVLLNKYGRSFTVPVRDVQRNVGLNLNMEPNEMMTIVY